MNPLSRFARLAVVTVVLALAAAPSNIASAESPLNPDAAPARLLIGVQNGLTAEQVAAQLEAEGLALGRYWPRFGIAEAIQSSPSPRAMAFGVPAVQSASVSQAFRYVSPDQRVYAAETDGSLLEPPMREPQPNDAHYIEQYAPGHVKAVEAWNISHGDPDVVIGIIDSGYDANHPDLDAARIWKNQVEASGKPGVDDDGNGLIDDISGWDWVDGDNVLNDTCGHGTHVLGVIAATTGNSIGIAGTGRNLTVVPLKMLENYGGSCSGQLSDVIDALDYAIASELDIVNMSLTIGFDNPGLRDAIESASNAGVLVVAAAGNSGSSVLWPAAYPESVAVAATDWQDQRSGFSSFGPEVDIAAPGSDVLSLYPGSSYAKLDGTSMATPHVSTLLGLVRSLRPDFSNQQAIDLMRASADDVNAGTDPGDDPYLGAGRINLYQALLEASTGLTLRATPQTLDPLPAGDTLALAVRVTVAQAAGTLAAQADAQDAAIPVAGAVVYAQVLELDGSASSDAAVRTQRRISNSNGAVNFNIAAPDEAGAHVLRIQVGAKYTDLPLLVIDPFSVGLHVASPELEAGDGATMYRVGLRDDEGNLLQDDAPLNVVTTVGTLDGGVTNLKAVAQNGIFTGTLYAGTVAGSGKLTVSVGTRTAVRDIRVLPAAPSQVGLAERPGGTYSDATATYFSFDITVQDQYGNAVENGTAVRLTSSAGELTPVLLATQHGVAYAVLRIPRDHVDPVTVVAEIPGLEVVTEIQVLGIPPLIWLPSVWAQQ